MSTRTAFDDIHPINRKPGAARTARAQDVRAWSRT